MHILAKFSFCLTSLLLPFPFLSCCEQYCPVTYLPSVASALCFPSRLRVCFFLSLSSSFCRFLRPLRPSPFFPRFLSLCCFGFLILLTFYQHPIRAIRFVLLPLDPLAAPLSSNSHAANSCLSPGRIAPRGVT